MPGYGQAQYGGYGQMAQDSQAGGGPSGGLLAGGKSFFSSYQNALANRKKPSDDIKTVDQTKSVDMTPSASESMIG